MSEAIRSVQPDARIGISILGVDEGVAANRWSEKVLRAAAGCYDFLVGHYYAGGPGVVCDTCFESYTVAYNYAVLRSQVYRRQQAGKFSARDVVHYDTEWGGWATRELGNDTPSVEMRNENSYGTLMHAVRLIYYLREGIVDGASRWALFSRDTNHMEGLLTHMTPEKRSMV